MAKRVNCTECLKNKLYKIYKKAMAFTLAETLIVMGVIGVVAALTLPNLNQSTGNKEKVAKVKKIYQNLNDAFDRAQVVYGPTSGWCSNYTGSCANRYLERLTEFMKTSKICNSVSVCSVTLDIGSGGYSYSKSAVLADGTVFVVNSIDKITGSGAMLVDIDGTAKGKNKAGSDIFAFIFDSDNGVYVSNCSDNNYVGVNSYSIAYYAATWVINFDNMDYLKTTNGTTCPNGTKLTFGGNHSCN